MNLLITIIVFSLLAIMYKVEYIKEPHDFFGFLEDSSKSSPLKLLCAIIVLVGHVYAGNIWLKPVHDLGYLMVAVFFALSGYGIAKTKEKLESNPKHWIVHRLAKIIIPFWFVNLICIVLYGFTIEKMTLYKVIGYLVGIPLINHPAWFLWMLLILDIGFAACYVKRRKHSFALMLAYILLISTVCAIANLDKAWFGSNFAFALGIFLESKEQKICTIMVSIKKWSGSLGICFLITAVGYVLYKVLSLGGAFINYFILRNMISITFCAGLFIFMYRIKLTCRVPVLEKCYFEIFLIHTPVQTILVEVFNVTSSFSLTLLTLSITALISVLWHVVAGKGQAIWQLRGVNH